MLRLWKRLRRPFRVPQGLGHRRSRLGTHGELEGDLGTLAVHIEIERDRIAILDQGPHGVHADLLAREPALVFRVPLAGFSLVLLVDLSLDLIEKLLLESLGDLREHDLDTQIRFPSALGLPRCRIHGFDLVGCVRERRDEGISLGLQNKDLGVAVGQGHTVGEPGNTGLIIDGQSQLLQRIQELPEVGDRHRAHDRGRAALRKILGQRDGQTKPATLIQALDERTRLEAAQPVDHGLSPRVALGSQRLDQILEIVGQLRHRFGRDDDRLSLRRLDPAQETQRTHQEHR